MRSFEASLALCLVLAVGGCDDAATHSADADRPDQGAVDGASDAAIELDAQATDGPAPDLIDALAPDRPNPYNTPDLALTTDAASDVERDARPAPPDQGLDASPDSSVPDLALPDLAPPDLAIPDQTSIDAADATTVDAAPEPDMIPPEDGVLVDPRQIRAEVRRRAGCNSGVTGFTLDVPLWAATPADGFAERFLAALQIDPAQLCEVREDDVCEPPAQVTPVLRPTLSELGEHPIPPAQAAWADDAQARFFELTFTDADGARLQVPEAHQCVVMAAVRAAAAAADETPFFVSRTWCALNGLGIAEGLFGPRPLTRWHFDHLDVRFAQAEAASVVYVIDANAGADNFNLQSVVDASAVRPPGAEFDYDGVGTSTHGRAMAAYVSEAGGGGTWVEARETLDRHGVTTVGVLANSLLRALFEQDSELALPPARIFNLSLGWPPELERRRVVPLRCAEVESLIEDPVGEPVKYVLAGMAQVDGVGAPRLVVAAAGNRPVPVLDSEVYGTPTPVQPATPCPAGVAPIRGFYPAEYWREPICRADGQPIPVPLLPVGGHDASGALTGTRILGAEVPLVAPSDHVYAHENPGAADPPPDDVEIQPIDCDAAGQNRGGHGVFPAVFSGSSVAAALTSGLAGRMLTEPALRARFSGRMLAAFLYLTADETPHVRAAIPPAAPTPIRRATYSHLRAALAADALEGAFMNCLAGAAAQPDLFRAALACELPRAVIDPLPTPRWTDDIQGCVDELAEPPPPAPPAAEWQVCGAALAGCRGGPGRMDRGALGPLPTSPICPECQATVRLGDGRDRIHLDLWLNPQLEAAEFRAPKLYLSGPIRSYALDLAPFTDVQRWSPNTPLKLAAIPLPADFDPEELGDSKLLIDAIVVQPAKRTGGVEPSILRIHKP